MQSHWCEEISMKSLNSSLLFSKSLSDIVFNQFKRRRVQISPTDCLLSFLFIGHVTVTYLGIRGAHERVWLVERKPIWLPRAYLTRGDLEPARGNLHVCKFLGELTNIQIRTVTAERKLCSECIYPTTVLQLNEGRKEGRKQASKGRKEGRKEGENQKERE